MNVVVGEWCTFNPTTSTHTELVKGSASKVLFFQNDSSLSFCMLKVQRSGEGTWGWKGGWEVNKRSRGVRGADSVGTQA